jgi:hypothetical protein
MQRSSGYRITERPDGFVVEAAPRVPVRVTMDKTGFRVEIHRPKQMLLVSHVDDDDSEDESDVTDTTLIQYRRLVDLVSPPPPRCPSGSRLCCSQSAGKSRTGPRAVRGKRWASAFTKSGDN